MAASEEHRATKSVTVRLPLARLRRVMRARRAATEAELLNVLLAEEQERIESAAVLRATSGMGRYEDLEDRLL